MRLFNQAVKRYQTKLTKLLFIHKLSSVRFNRTLLTSFVILSTSGKAFAQPLSPNGYSRLGLVPSAKTLNNGAVIIAFDPTVPGAPITTGYNTQVGFGLMDNLELVGRLATNNHNCNVYQIGSCPENSYRDFSSSMKWSMSIDWLKQHSAAVAVGATDFGGAATYFRSYYVVGTKSFDKFDLSLG